MRQTQVVHWHLSWIVADSIMSPVMLGKRKINGFSTGYGIGQARGEARGFVLGEARGRVEGISMLLAVW